MIQSYYLMAVGNTEFGHSLTAKTKVMRELFTVFH